MGAISPELEALSAIEDVKEIRVVLVRQLAEVDRLLDELAPLAMKPKQNAPVIARAIAKSMERLSAVNDALIGDGWR